MLALNHHLDYYYTATLVYVRYGTSLKDHKADNKYIVRARLDCLTKPCDIIHMIVFSPKYQSDGFISRLHCLSEIFHYYGKLK